MLTLKHMLRAAKLERTYGYGGACFGTFLPEKLRPPTTPPKEKVIFDAKEQNEELLGEDPIKYALRMAKAFKGTIPEMAKNYETYAANHTRLLEEGEGTYVLIVSGQIVKEGIGQQMDAVNLGIAEIGNGPMLVEKVVRRVLPLHGPSPKRIG